MAAVLECALRAILSRQRVVTFMGERGLDGGAIHCGSLSLVGWSDAAFGDQFPKGKCRPGFAISLMSNTLNGPFCISLWASKFTRKLG